MPFVSLFLAIPLAVYSAFFRFRFPESKEDRPSTDRPPLTFSITALFWATLLVAACLLSLSFAGSRAQSMTVFRAAFAAGIIGCFLGILILILMKTRFSLLIVGIVIAAGYYITVFVMRVAPFPGWGFFATSQAIQVCVTLFIGLIPIIAARTFGMELVSNKSLAKKQLKLPTEHAEQAPSTQ